MRTADQIKRVGRNYGLNTQRISILLHLRNKLRDQKHLEEVAYDLKKATNSLVSRLLDNIVAPNRSPHDGVRSQWGEMILMEE